MPCARQACQVPKDRDVDHSSGMWGCIHGLVSVIHDFQMCGCIHPCIRSDTHRHTRVDEPPDHPPRWDDLGSIMELHLRQHDHQKTPGC